jgi:hypothetical protein
MPSLQITEALCCPRRFNRDTALMLSQRAGATTFAVLSAPIQIVALILDVETV